MCCGRKGRGSWYGEEQVGEDCGHQEMRRQRVRKASRDVEPGVTVPSSGVTAYRN